MDELFDSIASGNCILFLGAGASITSKHKYLSKDLISYYSEIANIPYEDHNNDIVDFVDKVFSIKDYDRTDFDRRISDWLGRKLVIEDHHIESIKIPWKLILTTNIDTLIEDSVYENGIENSFQFLRSLKEFNQNINSNTKTKVIKLHGCITDIGKYSVLFSTKDFEGNNKFYQKIYSLLNQFSENTKILFIGYSFNDRFGKLFLNQFQDKLIGRHHYLVSPNLDISNFNMKFLESKSITPIKKNYETFVKEYFEWFSKNKSNYDNKSKHKYLLPNKAKINSHLTSQLESFIIPINNSYYNENIGQKDFYLGKEPNYLVAKKNFDVIKQQKNKEVKSIIFEKFKNIDLECSVVFLKGAYGTGKSTFAYRLIKDIIIENDDILAFEIIDFNKLNINQVKSLIFNLENVSQVIIYSDFTDLEYNFIKLRELRGELNAEQYEDKSIVLLQSIRENRLEFFKTKFRIKKYEEIDINCKFSDKELNELLSKLGKNSIIDLKDEKSKQDLIKEISIDQELNNPLAIFLKIIENGNHSKYILSAFNQFENDDTKNAFKYTCLLYQYGIKMPYGVLKNLISSNFQNFKKNVLNSDGKGIFIQENNEEDKYLMPDLYFKIKHKILAKKFVENFYKNENKIFKDFNKICLSLSSDSYSTKLFIALIKELKLRREFDQSKINKLFETAFKKIGLNKHFLIHYTKNLQFRPSNRIINLEKALKLIEEYEINDDQNKNYFSRDEYLTHRKACVKFYLAKQLYEDDQPYFIEEFDEAVELFDIKLSLNPYSIFSYRNYLKALMWFDHLIDNDEQKTINQIRIYKLINKAIDNLDESGDEIIRLQNSFKKNLDEVNLLERIESLYDSKETRPYALLMKIEYLQSKGQLPDQDIIDEIEDFTFIDDVAEFLLHYKGHRLHNVNTRIEFFNLVNNNKKIIDKNKLDFLYYSFIAEIYNRNIKYAFDHQKEIRKLFPSAKIKHPLYYIDPVNDEELSFEGHLIKQKTFYNLKLTNNGLYLNARINNKKYDIEKLKKINIKANLYFSYTGLWADIINYNGFVK